MKIEIFDWLGNIAVITSTANHANAGLPPSIAQVHTNAVEYRHVLVKHQLRTQSVQERVKPG